MAKNRWGVPAELADWIERKLPGGHNRALRYQLRQAARAVLAWDEDGELLTVAPMTPAQERAKKQFTDFFERWLEKNT